MWLVPGRPVFWAGIASMQFAIWCWVYNTVDNAAVIVAGMCCCVSRRFAALLVQCLTWYFVCWSEHRRSSRWTANGVGQHTSRRNCCQCFDKIGNLACLLNSYVVEIFTFCHLFLTCESRQGTAGNLAALETKLNCYYSLCYRYNFCMIFTDYLSKVIFWLTVMETKWNC